MVSDSTPEVLLEPVIRLVRTAGAAILTARAGGDLQTTYKADQSPLTRADVAANDILMRGLQQLTPTIPIVSEESLNLAPPDRTSRPSLWLVDALDGTKELVAGRPEFTVNVGLVRAGRPVLGVVYAPAGGVLYYGAAGRGAWRQRGSEPPRAIAATSRRRKLVATVSRSHQNVATRAFLQQLGPHEEITLGSSLKFGLIADGTADVYPRLHPTMEWDTAAADAIVRAAGGTVHDYDTGRPLRYNKPDLHNPSFVAATESFYARQR